MQLQKTGKQICVIPIFPAPWQQKQQYQKVRNSFLQDRQRGICVCVCRGALIGSAATSMLLLTQPKWTMCAIHTRNFYRRLIATAVGHERKKHKKEKRECCRENSFPASIFRGYAVWPWDNIHCWLRWRKTSTGIGDQCSLLPHFSSRFPTWKTKSLDLNANDKFWELKVTCETAH